MNLGKLASRLAVVSGVVFTMAILTGSAHAQSYTVLHSFDSTNFWLEYPQGGLLRDADGNLYGNTQGALFELATDGTVSVLHTFTGGNDGADPFGPLLRGPGGNFYGVTLVGGIANVGTVYELTSGKTERVLYTFEGSPHGAIPVSGVVRDASGNLYGTTSQGGAFDGYGLVFKISATDQSEADLYSFSGGAKDGGSPTGIALDSAGNIYGAASFDGGYGFGTVYKLSPDGTLTVLHSFSGTSDGAYPTGPVLLDSAGNLYGLTLNGGNQLCPINYYGCGTVYKLASTGEHSVLLSFGGTRGALPLSLTMDSTGNLYGITGKGGYGGCLRGAGCGVLFKVNPSGQETVLHTFGVDPADGRFPNALILSGGNLYGTTPYGGQYGFGTVFQYTLK